MYEIEVRDPDGRVERHRIHRGRTRIGRSQDNDIRLNDHLLSRFHIELHSRPDGCYLLDLDSRNGTRLNGRLVVNETRLQPGDRVALGDCVITFGAAGYDAPALDDGEDPAEEALAIPAVGFSDPDTDSGSLSPLEALAEARRALGTLTRAASALLTQQPLEELFRFVLDQIFEAIPADRGAILLLDGQRLQIRASRTRLGPPLDRVSRSIASRVLEQKVAVLLKSVAEDPELRRADSVTSLKIRSALCAPLWLTSQSRGSEQVIGLVYLDMQGETDRFGENDLRLLTALANVAASRIEHARLLGEALQKRRLEQDLRLAAEIQLALLPGEAPRLTGYDMCGSSAPCLAVGGDYYDFNLLGDDLVLALGDVAGKGTSAALLTTALRSTVRAHWREPDVAACVERINEITADSFPQGRYVTFFMARLRPEAGKLSYVNAGHNPPVLVHAGGDWETLREGGTVLGLFPESRYTAGTARLAPGDVLAVFSDGFAETTRDDGEEFGELRLADVVRACRDRDARGIERGVLASLEVFSGGAAAADDRTLVVLKRT